MCWARWRSFLLYDGCHILLKPNMAEASDHQPDRKAETHARIVRMAARAIRRHGYAGVGVADIMKDAGLTHGGFYAHFDSKTALLAEAADHAGIDGVLALRELAQAAPPGEGLAHVIDGYLSAEHVNAPELGCPVAALGSEIARQAPPVRAAATARIRDLIAFVESQLPGPASAARHEQAMALLAGMVGTLVLARAVDDAQLSRALRKAGRKRLRQQLQAGA